MPTRLGPFQFVYTEREQKMRDTIAHLINRHGLARARIIVNNEYHRAALLKADSEPAIWWNDVRWHIHDITSNLRWGQERGL